MASTTESQQKPSIRIFSSPGLKPDVRLEVFGTEFHVHSIILKLNSAFFRKFLDSPDKKLLESPPAPFLYEWVTKVDEDGKGWCLVAAGETQATASNVEFAKDQSFETVTFERLLCVMYGKPNHFEWTEQEFCLGLQNLTAMADYYCALPALSRSLYSVLITEDAMMNHIWTFPVVYFPLALKLRNPAFFKQVVLLSINPWRSPAFKIKKDILAPQEYKYLDNVYNSVCAMVTEVNMMIKSFIERNASFRPLIRSIEKSISEDDYYLHPEYYFEVSQNAIFRDEDDDEFTVDEQARFSFLLRNLTEVPIRLQSSGDIIDISNYREHFLCIDIKDEDLPWDTTQEDW